MPPANRRIPNVNVGRTALPNGEPEPQNTGRPFDLVNEFIDSRRRMQSGNGGLGPFGQQPGGPEFRPHQRTMDLGRQFHNARMSQQPQQGAARPASGLVDWNGHKIDRSVLGYAQQISQRFPGLRFSSGYRDPAHNARVNGVPNSWHLKGRAMDFSGSAKDMQNAAAWARGNGAREVLVHNAGSGTHLHLAW